MTRDDCDTASRLIAKFLQFTLPGQIELPLDWVNDLEESEEVAPFSDDKSYVDKQIKKNGVEFFSSPKNKVKHEKLEDGELLEEDENKNNAGKEDDQKASSPNTSFDSLDACYNGILFV
uniref:Uncharacterized protein n=1 Tax=Panagrolaimus superbus TaxID=310955 RepID=A0A914YYP0_9BILA